MYIYGDESGDFKHDFFVIGLLLVHENKNEHFENLIKGLRTTNKYYQEFKYHDNTEKKVPFCKEAIDLFCRSPELEFRCQVIETKKYDLSRFERKFLPAEELSYNFLYKQTIKYNVPSTLTEKIVVIIDEKTKSKNNNLEEYIKYTVPNISDVQSVDSSKHNLIQLTDLLTGSVYGKLTRVKNHVKRHIISHIEYKLGLPYLTARVPQTKDKFSVWFWNPPKK